jgi:hypothetical protein
MSKLLCIWERRSPNVTAGGRGWVGARLGAPGYDPRPCMRPRVFLYPRLAARGERVASAMRARDARRARVAPVCVRCACRARVARCVRVRVIRFGFARLSATYKLNPN